jgi:hypothetical protein
MCRSNVACLFEPDDRLVYVRLQKIHNPNQLVPPADVRIAGADANRLLDERDYLFYRPGVELALAEAN